jgi:hypothetical protein
MAHYNRLKAVEYAQCYAEQQNQSYPFYDGNDCSNFISQALLAGGWFMIPGWAQNTMAWWHKNASASPNPTVGGGGILSWSDASRTWTKAAQLYQHLFLQNRGSKVKGPEELTLGDLVFQEINGRVMHSMMVTKKSSDDIALSYHSHNRLNKPLKEILASYTESTIFHYCKVHDAIGGTQVWQPDRCTDRFFYNGPRGDKA